MTSTANSYSMPVSFSVTGTYGNAEHPDEDDVYTVAEFKDYCEKRLFIDYDGFGHPVRDRKANPSIWIKPSRLNEIPADATHVVWYNR